MSKIKIVGHASGSGVLTIAAPNTNTDRTITIPDVTGTLLDSGSDLPAANLTGTIADARFPSTLPAISGANLTGITGTTTRIHAFSTNAAGDLIWTHSESSLDLQNGSGVDIYKDVVIGSSDQVYSINSDGQLICTFT